MSRREDLTGRKFNRWTVLEWHHATKSAQYWTCRCDCGTEKVIWAADLKRGMSKSCGCYKDEMSRDRLTTHGRARHAAYKSWIKAKTRCSLGPKDRSYHLYAGRGISVAKEWDTFEAFWSDMGETWFKGASLDRIDNDKGYEPGNCRWATPKGQANNRRTNHIIPTPIGPMNITQAAEAFGIDRRTIYSRIRYGWVDDRLLLGATKRPDQK